MNVQNRLWDSICLVGALLLAAAAAPVTAQAPGGAAEEEKFPEGRQLPRAEYERVEEVLTLAAPAMTTAAAVGSGAEGLLQSRLPEGITLGEGIATQVMAGLPAVGSAAPAAEMMEEEEAAPPQSQEKWFIVYPVEYQGVPVAKSSDMLAIVGGDGRLLYLRQRNMPQDIDATEATVDAGTAIAIGRTHAGEAFAEAAASEPELECWVDAQQKCRLAWSFTLQSESLSDPKARSYWVAAAGEPRVLNWESQIYHTHFGTVSGTLWPASPFDTTASRTLRDLEVTRTPPGDTALTGDDGRYSFPSGGGNRTIDGELSGPFSDVQNQAGADLQISNSGNQTNPIDVNFGAAGEFQTAQVTAFYWTNETYHLARSILDPLPGAPFANLPTRVNLNNTCNAFWNGSSINFFRAGAGCPNTAYSDVVAHEYGHGIDSWRGGIVDGGYSEGFGDAMALLLTRQPCVGRDFFGPGTCLRLATDVNLWPPAPGEGVHSQGKRYGQFTWQLVQELTETFSEEESFRLATRLVLAAAAGNPSDIPDAVELSFLADDDDANLANGTPHCDQLAAAADSRNLPHPRCPGDRLGYAWANNASAASYTPSVPYSHNSSGGPINITRQAAGRYRVRFNGLGGSGIVGGNVQVTAYGPGSQTCKVVSWGSGGSHFLVNVRCFNAAGALVDTRYTVLVTWP